MNGRTVTALWCGAAFVSAAAVALAVSTSSVGWESVVGFVFGVLAGGAAGLAKGSARGLVEAEAARTAAAAAIRRLRLPRRDFEAASGERDPRG